MTNHKSKLRWFIILMVIQIVVLLGWTGSSMAVERYGTMLTLAAKTSYVNADNRQIYLEYEINAIPEALWKGAAPVSAGQRVPVYVLLQREGTLFKAVGLYPTKPQAQAKQVVLEGRMIYTENSLLHVQYGIESCTIPSSDAQALSGYQGALHIQLTIAPWGQMKISSITKQQ